ncbi:flagellin [uncultured Clostridium sp.]|uniref:flagellin N-terminal helical domain-containing protein n=1 Tax=uncultured Clostridium sp. TaxID=59620 RepID=UPI00258C11AD|nr:flagellin [uncultured Clostridium sp.]
MIINHNMGALNANRQMGINQTNANKSMEKLSSGLRINRAGDDAAGLAISEKMRGQIRGLDQASANAQDGISLIQTAEGALNETHSILQRMRELAVQAGNDTNNGQDRGEIQKEINQLTSEINRIGNTTEFNTQKLLNGEKDGSAAVAGVYKLDLSGGVGTSDITIGGKTFTYNASADGSDKSEFKDLSQLVAGLQDAVAGISGDYDVTESGGVITFTQKTGKESSTGIKSNVGDVTTTIEGKTAGTGSNVSLQIGANENQSMSLNIGDMRAAALGLTGTAGDNGFTAANTVTDGTNNTENEAALSVANAKDAANSITKIQSAIDNVSSERSKLGAFQNRLEHTINNLGTSSENLTSAESRIRDVNMAKEMSTFSKNNILSQAAQAMLAQANQQPQQVLQLLR